MKSLSFQIGEEIHDIFQDLRDGRQLLNLLELLTQEKLVLRFYLLASPRALFGGFKFSSFVASLEGRFIP